MISAIGSFVSRWFRRVCPDPFVIVILLSVLTVALALVWGTFPNLKPEESRFTKLFDGWWGENGFWKFLTFSMQISLILVTGHALARTRPVSRMVDALASRPRTTRQAAGLIGVTACLTGLLHWGLSLIVGAMLAREVGRSMHARGLKAHYPLLVAAGYTGLLVFHGGLSGTAPLSVTTPANASKVLLPAMVEKLGAGIGLERTIFSPLNFFVTGGMVVLIPVLLVMLTPRRQEEMQGIDEFEGAARFRERDAKGTGSAASAAATDGGGAGSIPERLDKSMIVAWMLAAPLFIAAMRYCYLQGVQQAGAGAGDSGAAALTLLGLRSVGLNEINLFMFALGMLLHASPRAYMEAAEEGAAGCAGIIIQFPLYGGIMGMMSVSGLDRVMAEAFVQMGGPTTMPLLTFFSACVIGLFVASGGGQWGIQGPIALQTAFATGVDPAKMVMAVSYGDEVPNMLQPFWALPLLAITGVRARDIVGYTTVVMLFAFVWISLGLVVF